MRIYLTKQVFSELLRIRREENIDSNELINRVLMSYFKTRGEQSEQPKYRCEISGCSARFFSKENLAEHIQRKHEQKPLQNETPA